MPVRGKRRKTVVRNDFSPVSRPIQNGELVDSASRCGRKYRASFIRSIIVESIGYRDVHVQSEDQQRPRQLLQLLDDVLVALARRDDLIDPVREGVRAGGGDAQADALRGIGEIAAIADDFLGQLADVRTDLGPDLDDRLVHLALDLIAEGGHARRQQLLHVRAKLPGLGIDDLELFLDADGERVLHGSAGGQGGDDFDFQHELGPRQAHDLDERARRRRVAEVPRADLPHGRRLVHVGDVGVHLHHVGELRARRVERRLQVLEHLLGLRLHVAGADDAAVLVERDLAGDVDGLSRSVDFDDVRVAGRLRQRRRIGCASPARTPAPGAT